MGKAKFEIEKIPLRDGSVEFRVHACKDIEEGENICKIGMDIDFLLTRLGLTEIPPPRIVRALGSFSAEKGDTNCEYHRDDIGCWYLRATKKIRENRTLISRNAPWFSGVSS